MQVSLWLQEYDGVSSPDDSHPLSLLWGKELLEEKLLGLKFTISPNSFFQAKKLVLRREKFRSRHSQDKHVSFVPLSTGIERKAYGRPSKAGCANAHRSE